MVTDCKTEAYKLYQAESTKIDAIFLHLEVGPSKHKILKCRSWYLQVDLLKQLSVSEFVKVVSVDANENVLKAIKESWPVQASHSVFVASTDGAAVTELTASGWNILYSGLQVTGS